MILRKSLCQFKLTNPELMSRWSSNNEEPMSHYLNNSCYRALWKCPDCGGEYISSIRDMATGNVDCVYCSMKEVLPGVNSFAVLHPDLMNEWNHLDNYLLCDPDQILDNCITPVCWTCQCVHTIISAHQSNGFFIKNETWMLVLSVKVCEERNGIIFD